MRIDLPKQVLAAAVALIVASGAVLAQPPEWAGQGKGKGKGKDRGEGKAQSQHFRSEHRSHVRDYYDSEFRGGHCPPGLRKKNNGCMPPGQAKKWRMGQPLPASVVYYEVPQPLVIRIGIPPAGYQYVRVASDILMIAIGTRMVVDAINDLGR